MTVRKPFFEQRLKSQFATLRNKKGLISQPLTLTFYSGEVMLGDWLSVQFPDQYVQIGGDTNPDYIWNKKPASDGRHTKEQNDVD
jgi:hypothetical protein